MADKKSDPLQQLQDWKETYGGEAAAVKLELLEHLEGAPLRRVQDISQLHEILCFLRAFPDSLPVLQQVERMLAVFGERPDLSRNREALANSGIAGTPIYYPFYWFAARWLVRHWPQNLTIDWKSFENKEALEGLLHLLVLYPETLALETFSYSLRLWVGQLKSSRETDAAFLIRRFEALGSSSFEREFSYERLDIPLRLSPGPDTPARTRARYSRPRVVFQTGPLLRSRPPMRREAMKPPVGVARVPSGEGERLIDLALEAMVTRSRDLDVFEHGDKNDVRMFNCGRGLQIAAIGALPERRLLMEAVYGFLALKNGVPVGYVVTSGLFNSSEVSFNIFETYRGAESALLYGRVVATVRYLFKSDAFTIDPYQLGHDNPEALNSGAWWFYYKLGFRPHDRGVRQVLKGERELMKANPRHRSSIATLKKLAAASVFLYLDRRRADVMGRLDLPHVGLQVTRYISDRFGSDRAKAERVCAREAARLLGLGSRRDFSSGERLAWKRWSPLMLILPGVENWDKRARRDLVRVVRAKGGSCESDFVLLFDRHRLLRQAVLDLTRENPE